MKKTWLAVALVLIFGAFIFVLLNDKVSVSASEIALVDQGWRAHFSVPLKKSAATSGGVFINNDKGEKITVDSRIENGGKTVYVNGLKPGSYTLHVKRNAVAGKLFKVFPIHVVSFTVHESLESVKGEKELVAYFSDLKKRQKDSIFSMNRLEESRVSEDKDVSSSQAGDADYSTTNNQVDGIDESDFVKTDGEYIYTAISSGNITITDIRNPNELKKAGEIKIGEDFYANQLFLHGDLLVVLGEKFKENAIQHKFFSSNRMMPGVNMTTANIYDVSKKEKPKLIRQVGAEGYINGARKSGDILYFVTNLQPQFWAMDDMDPNFLRPQISDSKKDNNTTALDYKEITIMPGAMEPTYTVITAIDLASPAQSKVVTKGYLGASEQLYMSKEHLYLTASVYNEIETKNDDRDMVVWNMGANQSELFKFTLKGTAVEFHSSTSVKGTILNQFSMDEHEGYLRLVTTEGNARDDRSPSENHLIILDESLKTVGSVEGLAKGERIYSARFMGDKAYMVTFKETDPLFVIDVAEPTAPKVLGELKIPGFSNYLHPLDETHLIGFGSDTVVEKNPAGGEPNIVTQGMKISLFDVSDFNSPKEQDSVIIGGKGTYSQLQNDHKALFQHKERNLFGFPIMVYHESKKNSEGELEFDGVGAVIYEITAENGIVLKADLTEKSQGEQYSEYEKEIHRLIYSKESIYTISMQEINQYSMDNYSKTGTLAIQ